MLTKSKSAIILLVGLLLSVCACAQTPNCEIDNPQLQAMRLVEVELIRTDNSSKVVQARMADNNATRAAGFQRICESTIEDTPILFVFQRAVMPKFHMHNVVAPIDIAFIDEHGAIDSMHAMKPYVLASRKRPQYGSNKPIRAALEVHEGFFQEHDINMQSKIVWRDLPADQ